MSLPSSSSTRTRDLLTLAALALAACSDSAPEPQLDPDDTTASVQAIPADSILAWRRGPVLDPAVPLSLIALGSCNREDRPQPLWDPIVAAQPDLWIWLGDNIYGDTDDMAVMQAKYEQQLASPGYRTLVEQTAIIGTWDDHDYGLNDGGSEFPARVESQREALDFFGEPANSPRRAQAGIYTSYVYGPRGRRVKVILLDARYHRDQPNEAGTGDLLGEAQWTWLADELANSDAQVHLIGDGIQFIPIDHQYEKWNQFPEARQRLLEVIGGSGAPGVVLLSGDRHLSEFHRLEDPALGYPLYEVTSSGMTHSFESVGQEPNRYRVGELYELLSYATLSFDWDAGTIDFRLHDTEGTVVREHQVSIAELSPGGP